MYMETCRKMYSSRFVRADIDLLKYICKSRDNKNFVV